jgi:pimeloyl-ACP methyl ester carboxylesterase
MASFARDDVSIHYEEIGSGFPLLLLAPGGLDSTIDFWPRAALNPIEAYADDFHLVAMDQRNAGSSTGPFEPDDPWGSFVGDQLALMEHLGFDRFLVMGCCIGCSYALKISELVPERLIAAVLEQPIGITDENKETWLTNRRAWVSRLVSGRPDLDEETGEAFGAAMWTGGEFVVSVSREFVQSCPTPLMVLPGVDMMHPYEIGLEVGTLAPDAVTVDPWKEPAEVLSNATDEVRQFLYDHSERAS